MPLLGERPEDWYWSSAGDDAGFAENRSPWDMGNRLTSPQEVRVAAGKMVADANFLILVVSMNK
jgi:hypothetical protein